MGCLPHTCQPRRGQRSPAVPPARDVLRGGQGAWAAAAWGGGRPLLRSGPSEKAANGTQARWAEATPATGMLGPQRTRAVHTSVLGGHNNSKNSQNTSEGRPVCDDVAGGKFRRRGPQREDIGEPSPSIAHSAGYTATASGARPQARLHSAESSVAFC